MTHRLKFVSVIVPCREEEKYVARTLESILANDYPQDLLEVLVVDGMSTDGTREIVTEFSRRHPFITLLDNPKLITPAALNIGIARSKGDIILRVDSHSVIPVNYISSLVAWQEKTGADNVGGVCVNHPANDTSMAKAIAIALSYPFGVGDAYFRIGTPNPRFVDTVPFGCFRREIFNHVGTFDEEHVRTEDDEFNMRLNKHGGRILLIPDLHVSYYPRETLPKIWQMYYQYGYFKALVARKLGWVLKLRHIIPSLFVLTLSLSLLLSFWLPVFGVVAGLVLAMYIAADVVFAWMAGRRQGLAVSACLLLVFPALHFSYGLGFLKGLLDFFVFGKKGVADTAGVPLSR